jgi:hypothetical protein
MRMKTFNCIADEIERVEAVADMHLSAFLLRLDPDSSAWTRQVRLLRRLR